MKLSDQTKRMAHESSLASNKPMDLINPPEEILCF